MIVLKDVLTPLEWRTTMLILKLTKTIFGEEDYIMFKKMVMVVGFIHGLQGYIGYQEFINSALDLIKHSHKSPVYTFGFEQRFYNESFFGVNKRHIVESTLEEIRDEMAEKRSRILKVEQINPFPLHQNN